MWNLAEAPGDHSHPIQVQGQAPEVSALKVLAHLSHQADGARQQCGRGERRRVTGPTDVADVSAGRLVSRVRDVADDHQTGRK